MQIRLSRFLGARRCVKYIASLVVASLVLAATPVTAAGSTLEGTVRFEGDPGRLRAIRMNADPNCEKMHEGERVLQDDRVISDSGELANVFVYLEELPSGVGPFEPPETAVTLTQSGCMYSPKVQGILVKQNLDVINDDPTLHNVRCLARDNRAFNLGQPSKGKRTKFFTKPEKAVKFKCDVHPWMSSFIFVMEHPFFSTSDSSGTFEIEGLPEGKHTFVAWHEVFGEQRAEVTISAEGGNVDFVFTGE